MIYQRQLRCKPKAQSMSRHKNTLIFLLDPKDEPDRQQYFHMVELTFDEWKSSKQCDEKKLRDWTGQCDDEELVSEMTFARTKNNYLIVATK